MRAGVSVASTGFGVERLATVGAEVVSKRAESVVDVVRHAVGMCATLDFDIVREPVSSTVRADSRVVRVEVLVDIEDKVGDTSIGVRHLAQRICGAVGDKGLSRGPVVTGKEDELRGSANKRY